MEAKPQQKLSTNTISFYPFYPFCIRNMFYQSRLTAGVVPLWAIA